MQPGRSLATLVHAEVVASLLDRRLPRGDSVRAGPLRLGPGAGSPQGGPARRAASVEWVSLELRPVTQAEEGAIASAWSASRERAPDLVIGG